MTKQEYNFQWNKSKKGVCIRLWHHNVKNSITRGHKPPEYSQDELINWVLNHPEFNTLYTNWVNSGYLQDMAVSIDRLDDSKGYSFSNIQLITFRENYLKSHDGVRNNTIHNSGLLHGGHTTVYQYTVDGELIKEHISFSEAARCLGKGHQLFSRVIQNGSFYAYGYLWCTDYTKQQMLSNINSFVPKSPNKFKAGKILKTSINGEIVAIYSSMAEASTFESVSEHIIRCWIAGKPTRKQTNYIFTKEYNV